MRIIVTGLIGQYPFGGVIWDYLQYLLGFRSLGHEVLYLEDSGAWPYDPEAGTITDDCSFALRSLKKIFADFDLPEAWVYRNGADGKFYGAGESKAREWLRHGDLLVNVSSAGWLRDYDLRVGHRMFIDGDPMFCQIGLLDGSDPLYAGRLRDHDSHFTFGLSVGTPGCPVPTDGIAWKPTVQPAALEHWSVTETPADAPWTTVMNWASYRPKIWEGRPYGQKDREFEKFTELPRLTRQKLKIAMGLGGRRQATSGETPFPRLESGGTSRSRPRSLHLSGFPATFFRRMEHSETWVRGGGNGLVQLPKRLLPCPRSPRRGSGNGLEPTPTGRARGHRFPNTCRGGRGHGSCGQRLSFPRPAGPPIGRGVF